MADLREENRRLDERAREAWRSRAEDAKRIGELSANVEHLTKSNQSLETQVERLAAMVRHLLPEPDRILFERAYPNRNKTKEQPENVLEQTQPIATPAP